MRARDFTGSSSSHINSDKGTCSTDLKDHRTDIFDDKGPSHHYDSERQGWNDRNGQRRFSWQTVCLIHPIARNRSVTTPVNGIQALEKICACWNTSFTCLKPAFITSFYSTKKPILIADISFKCSPNCDRKKPNPKTMWIYFYPVQGVNGGK